MRKRGNRLGQEQPGVRYGAQRAVEDDIPCVNSKMRNVNMYKSYKQSHSCLLEKA